MPQLRSRIIKRSIEATVAGLFLGVAAYALATQAGDDLLNKRAALLADDLTQARREALSRGARVAVCASRDGIECLAIQHDWTPGWMVFVDADGDGERNVAQVSGEPVLFSRPPLSGGVRLTKAGSAVPAYRADGTIAGHVVAGFKLCSANRESGRAIPMARTGRSKPVAASCA